MQQFLVVEVLDPSSVAGVANVYVNLDEPVESVMNGFKSLRDSGQTLTGVFSRVERVNGELRRVEKFQKVQEGRESFLNGLVRGFANHAAYVRA